MKVHAVEMFPTLQSQVEPPRMQRIWRFVMSHLKAMLLAALFVASMGITGTGAIGRAFRLLPPHFTLPMFMANDQRDDGPRLAEQQQQDHDAIAAEKLGLEERLAADEMREAVFETRVMTAVEVVGVVISLLNGFLLLIHFRPRVRIRADKEESA